MCLGVFGIKRLFMFLLLLLLLTSNTLANTYEDEKFFIGVFQGWEYFWESDEPLVFNHNALNQYDSVYDFTEKQFDVVAKRDQKAFSKEEFYNEFFEHFSPVTLIIQAKRPIPTGEIKIEHLYTENFSLKITKLRAWEYEYKHLPVEYWTRSYTIHLPVDFLYKTVFLLPNKIAEETVSITIADHFGFRQSVSSKRIITENEAKTIVLTSQHFKGSLDSYFNWWKEQFNKPLTNVDVSVSLNSFPDDIERWWVTTSNLDGDPEVRSQVQISTYLVDKETGQMYLYHNHEGIVVPIDE